jgi:CsoR family transcriptional regulator, copper-sensing transcriptional repressor
MLSVTPTGAAGLTDAGGVRILPWSMDTHAERHFRHSYTRDRKELLNRLRRIEGQARGLQRLVENEAYCLDILQQVEAMTAAADQVAMLVLEDHIDGCLTHAIASGEGQPYVDEVMQVVRRAVGRPARRRPLPGRKASRTA